MPQMTVVFPTFTRAEPSAVDMEPEQRRAAHVEHSDPLHVLQSTLSLTYVQCRGPELRQLASIRSTVFFLGRGNDDVLMNIR